MRTTWSCALVAWALCTPCAAAHPSQDESGTVKIVLHPAAAPDPALKHQLLPPFIDRLPGNAAVDYGKAVAVWNDDLDAEISDMLDAPLDELGSEKAQKTVAKFDNVMRMLRLAARRERCDWQIPIREEPFYEILLPELQQMRAFSRVVVAQARVQIAAGQYDKAVETLQIGYALARDVGRGPTIVSGLVGVAISRVMASRVEELMQQPGAPNLYWALTMLPRPLVDLRPGVEAEMSGVYLWFPELRNVDDTSRSPEYWRQTIYAVWDKFTRLGDMSGTPVASQGPAVVTLLAIKGYPVATRWLIDHGMARQQVEAMPVAQAILIWLVQSYDHDRDQLFKWFFVPYPEARQGIERANDEVRQARNSGSANPLSMLLLPAIGAVRETEVASERKVAVLRTLEALRIYGAAHDGRLPDRLSDVTEVPVPDDPVTGRPFEYELKDGTAILTGPQIRGEPVRYEIRMEK